ncbi:MAG: YggS family pyridoxal phosphate-dependent enzyme [Acidimicrobiia bacterium]|nr:YggS family pyridoxal phosphate-dependent enzyme [Acidimicrobiia bacterium]
MEPPSFSIDVQANLETVLQDIEHATLRAGRPKGSVKLVAVSKTVDVESIRQAVAAGVTVLGENRVQEASSKRPLLADLAAEWHLIGSLQKNKANRAAEIFDWIESLDDLELAARLDRACERLAKRMPVLIQVNVGREASKSGIAEEEAIEFSRRLSGFTHLDVRGLMAIPPFTEDPEEARPYFIRLRELAQSIEKEQVGGITMKELSMGMSHDFPVAIQEGATLVRIGTAIFGPRQAR